ncbi:hypothetical protein AVEN_99135-1 [Araneus ventricosus]|uniref:Uncharacterized protein n=1 Tax=Araneus ventricosus TaxID=182803 RepID=A0A4Y2QQ58_ARAVE|nr:hypothetical protein AVEN_99135-1 [Araneus ventricosus]
MSLGFCTVRNWDYIFPAADLTTRLTAAQTMYVYLGVLSRTDYTPYLMIMTISARSMCCLCFVGVLKARTGYFWSYQSSEYGIECWVNSATVRMHQVRQHDD